MTQNFVSRLTHTQWNEEWLALQAHRNTADDNTYWDKRAKTFSSKDSPSAYVCEFIEKAHLNDDESIFDMGAGTGDIAIPLAKEGHEVIAADFSRGMLDELERRKTEACLNNIETYMCAWEDAWEDFGIKEKSVDVAIASRSLMMDDLEKAVQKLSHVAKRRVCLTIATSATPKTNEFVLRALGLKSPFSLGYIYLVLILTQLGFMPELSYIESYKRASFDSIEEAYETYIAMIDKAVGENLVDAQTIELAKNKLTSLLHEELIENKDAGKTDEKGNIEKALCMKTPQLMRWAFVAWNL